jgi:hypothetical protein
MDCPRCGVNKPESEFYATNHSSCKACISKYQKERRDRLNANRPESWKKKTKDMKAYMAEWRKQHPGYSTRRKAEWLAANPIRSKVKDAVRYALKTGKLVRLPCFECGSLESEAHHPDYSRPLDVIWLCKQHHRECHGK